MNLALGQTVGGRYRIEELIGRGGMAEVYRVRHAELGSVHALKLLLVEREGLSERLLLEGRIQAQLRHPNVVVVTDIVRHDGLFGLLMEYVDSLTLEDLLQRKGRLPVEVAFALLAPIMAGVYAAHRAGVLHRDLKPANVLLARTAGGLVPKVSDFGIAKVVAEGLDGGLTADVPIGTPGFMAPEQILDPRTVDVRTDVYALGAIAYQLLSGARPFADHTGYVTLGATLHGTYAPLAEVVEGLSPAVGAAIDLALDRSIEARFHTVGDFGQALFADHPRLRSAFDTLDGRVSAPLSLEPVDLPSQEIPKRLAYSPRSAKGPTLLPELEGTDPAIERAPVPPAPFLRRMGWFVVLIGAATVVLLAVGLAGATLRGEARERLGPPSRSAISEGGSERAAGGVGARPGADRSASDAIERTVDERRGREDRADGDRVQREAIAKPGADAAGAEHERLPEATRAAGSSVGTSRAAEGRSVDRPASEATAEEVPAARVDPSKPVEEGAEEGSAKEGALPTDAPPIRPTEPGPAEGSEATSDRVPAAQVIAEPPVGFVGSTYDGRLFRQPFTLRILELRDGKVRAEGRVVQGVNQRILRFSGTFEPATGSLSLREGGGDLYLEGKVSDQAIVGRAHRGARGEPSALDLRR